MRSIILSIVFVLMTGCVGSRTIIKALSPDDVSVAHSASVGSPIATYTVTDTGSPGIRYGIQPTPLNGLSNPSSFSQEIQYTGRSGDELRLYYREFQNDMARAAFSLELIYDLGSSKVVRFRDFAFEVVSADNSQIVYKIIKSPEVGTIQP
ncbi:MAG: hypothetical protein PHC51_06110 [bacterium]|nr:hypothetical protein [bacterium]